MYKTIRITGKELEKLEYISRTTLNFIPGETTEVKIMSGIFKGIYGQFYYAPEHNSIVVLAEDYHKFKPAKAE